MLKQKLFAAILLAGTLTIFSCKKDHTDNNNSNPATCTNNTGWIKNGHMAVYTNEPIYIFADTLYTTLEEVSTGTFKSTSKFDDGTLYPTQSVYLEPCNNSIYQALTADLANKQEVYRIDGNMGDTWTSTTSSSMGNTITTVTSITGKNISITVPAGTFSCIRFHQVSTSSAGGSVTTDTYLENNAGLIMADGTSVHYELVRKNY